MSYVLRNCLRKAAKLRLLNMSPVLSEDGVLTQTPMDALTLNILNGFIACSLDGRRIFISDKNLADELLLERTSVYRKRKDLISAGWLKPMPELGKKYVELNVSKLWEVLESANSDKSLDIYVAQLIAMIDSNLLPAAHGLLLPATRRCSQQQHRRNNKESIKNNSVLKTKDNRQPEEVNLEKGIYNTDSLKTLIRTRADNEEIREKDIHKLANELDFHIKNSNLEPLHAFNKAIKIINSGGWKTPVGFNHGSSVCPSISTTASYLAALAEKERLASVALGFNPLASLRKALG